MTEYTKNSIAISAVILIPQTISGTESTAAHAGYLLNKLGFKILSLATSFGPLVIELPNDRN